MAQIVMISAVYVATLLLTCHGYVEERNSKLSQESQGQDQQAKHGSLEIFLSEDGNLVRERRWRSVQARRSQQKQRRASIAEQQTPQKKKLVSKLKARNPNVQQRTQNGPESRSGIPGLPSEAAQAQALYRYSQPTPDQVDQTMELAAPKILKCRKIRVYRRKKLDEDEPACSAADPITEPGAENPAEYSPGDNDQPYYENASEGSYSTEAVSDPYEDTYNMAETMGKTAVEAEGANPDEPEYVVAETVQEYVEENVQENVEAEGEPEETGDQDGEDDEVAPYVTTPGPTPAVDYIPPYEDHRRKPGENHRGMHKERRKQKKLKKAKKAENNHDNRGSNRGHHNKNKNKYGG